MHAAATTMTVRDQGSLLVAGSFFLAFACVLGLIAYRLLSQPAARRAEFRTWRAWRKGTSALAGLALAMAVFAGFAASSLLGFQRIEISESHVVLGYVLPFDDVSLRRDDLAQVLREPGTGVACRLVLETRDGCRYESVPARADVVAAIHARIERGP
jgi:hypothetical protein